MGDLIDALTSLLTGKTKIEVTPRFLDGSHENGFDVRVVDTR